MTQTPTLAEMRQALATGAALQHAKTERTIQDVIDEMTPEQRELQALIVGAALENTDLSGNSDVVDSYNALSDEHKGIIDFTVGLLLSEDTPLKHDAMWEGESLEHYGVKGMKWGVIRDTARGGGAGRLSASSDNTKLGRATAAKKVDRGTATVKDAHLASLKSNGHRAINALSGDKTFWKRMAVTAGITTAAVVVPTIAAFALPAGVVGAIGTSALPGILGLGSATAGTAVSSGQFALFTAGAYTGLGTAAVGTVGNVVGNTARAAAGNTLINRSYDRISKGLADRQSDGRRRVNNILKGAAGIRDKDLMRHSALEGPPTLAEMSHAIELYKNDPDAYLEHYGVKGMKWGIRRSKELLARAAGVSKKAVVGTKDEEGNTVGGIRAASRAGAQKLKDMKEGGTLILTDADGASKIMSKQKDGTFKEVYLSADADRVLRTTKKDQSEMSDKEINDAINRAKKIEEYNKIFNPQPNPNADLQARVDAMKLEIQLRDAQRVLNPPRKKLTTRFIDQVSGGFSAYQRADKALNGQLNDLTKEMISELRKNRAPAATATAAAAAAASSTRPTAPSAAQQKKVDDFVYDITSMGKSDPNNPFYNPSTAIPPYYPELTERRD